MSEPAIILALAGLPSSGKGTFSEIAEEFGFKKFVMGDVIREECRRRGLDVTREASDFVMIELRKEKGKNAVAVVTLDWIKQAIDDNMRFILIDGIRSMEEVNYFKEFYPDMIIIGIHANPKTRLKRALLRKRIDDAYSENAFHDRDNIELNIGLGDVIAKSDILIVAEEDIVETKNTYSEVLRDIIKTYEAMLVAKN